MYEEREDKSWAYWAESAMACVATSVTSKEAQLGSVTLGCRGSVGRRGHGGQSHLSSSGNKRPRNHLAAGIDLPRPSRPSTSVSCDLARCDMALVL
ncbi:hypothetical protein HPP92_022070 [Vanilla planifolia]|uniref:Uncharacterized protein n=1 Tax=Vanilla planifolia TaxID=51239 RepID=A0A835PQ79_VANPL|nr:hypothetical protein HPP92_022070 [Vanilla planifolia]